MDLAILILIGISLALFSVGCVALTVIGLPGTWLMLAAAIGVELLRDGTFSMGTLVAVLVLAILGEVAEFLAGVLGASSQGASKRAGVGALVGGLLGAVIGTFTPATILGTIIGGAIGAGVGAALVEVAIREKTKTQVLRVGAGAFAGRLLATLIKGLFAVAMAIVLAIAAFA